MVTRAKRNRNTTVAVEDATAAPQLATRWALNIFSEAGQPVAENYVRQEVYEVLGREVGRSAIHTLLRRGQLVTKQHPHTAAPLLGMTEAAAAEHREEEDRRWRAQNPVSFAGSTCRPLSFLHRCLLAYLSQESFALTVKGLPYRSAARELEQRFAACEPDVLWDAYRDVAILSGLVRDESGLARLCPHAVDRWITESPRASAIRLQTGAMNRFRTCDWAVIQLGLRRPGWSTREEVERVARLAEAGAQCSRSWYWGIDANFLSKLVVSRLDEMEAAEIVQFSSDAPTSVRLHPDWAALFSAAPSRSSFTPAEAFEEGDGEREVPSVVVQPNLELLVPPEASTRTIYEIGRFCRLVRFDSVSVFELTPASIKRAASEGLTQNDLLSTLSRVAKNEVPISVRQIVKDHAGPPRVGTLLSGLVFHLPDLAEAPRSLGLERTELADVYTAPAETRSRVLRRLGRAGYSIREETQTETAPQSDAAELRSEAVSWVESLTALGARHGHSVPGADPE